jgi:hypothetical protein
MSINIASGLLISNEFIIVIRMLLKFGIVCEQIGKI